MENLRKSDKIVVKTCFLFAGIKFDHNLAIRHSLKNKRVATILGARDDFEKFSNVILVQLVSS